MTQTITPRLRSLTLKPDFEKTIERFEAWWVGEVIDRPPVTLHVRPERPWQPPVKNHASLRERWFDMDFQLALAVGRLEQNTFLADAIPVYYPNLGPELTATLYGCELEFSDTTSWSRPIVHTPDDWSRVLNTPPNFDQPYWRCIEEATRRAVEEARGRFIVGVADLHGNYDILASLRDPQALCEDLIDCPETVRSAGQHVTRGYIEAFERLYKIVAAAGMGATTWTPVYHEGPAYLPSCDFW